MRASTLRELGERIAEYRTFDRLTQAELADRVGVHRSMIAHLEQGYRRVPADVVRDVAEELQIPEEIWIGWATTPQPPSSLEVTAHLVTYFTSKFQGPDAAEKVRNELVFAVKNSRPFRPRPGARTIDACKLTAARLRRHHPHLFVGRTFVPVPTSVRTTEMQKDWPGLKLGEAMAAVGRGCAVVPMLTRTATIEKSSLSPGYRPSIGEHIATLSVAHDWVDTSPPGVVLVDDVVTKGATMVACARILRMNGWPGHLEGAAVAYTAAADGRRQDHARLQYTWAGDEQSARQLLL